MGKIQNLIKDFINSTINYKGKNKYLELGKVNKTEINTIKKITGIDLSNYMRIIDTSAINHIINKHGIKSNECKRGQIPITHSDFLLIPFIIKNANKITYKGKNKRNLDVILYETEVGDSYFYLEEVRRGRKQLCVNTFYKRKSP